MCEDGYLKNTILDYNGNKKSLCLKHICHQDFKKVKNNNGFATCKECSISNCQECSGFGSQEETCHKCNGGYKLTDNKVECVDLYDKSIYT